MARYFYQERKVGAEHWSPCTSICTDPPVPGYGFEHQAAPIRVPQNEFHFTLCQLRNKYGRSENGHTEKRSPGG